MMPLWMTAVVPVQSTWGWAFCSVGRPCVAAAGRAQLALGLAGRGGEAGPLAPLAAPRRLHVLGDLWPPFDLTSEVGQGPSLVAHEGQDLEGGEDPIAGRRELAEDDVAG